MSLDFWSILYWGERSQDWSKQTGEPSTRLTECKPVLCPEGLGSQLSNWLKSRNGVKGEEGRKIRLLWLNLRAQMHCTWSVSFPIYSTHDRCWRCWHLIKQALILLLKQPSLDPSRMLYTHPNLFPSTWEWKTAMTVTFSRGLYFKLNQRKPTDFCSTAKI